MAVLGRTDSLGRYHQCTVKYGCDLIVLKVILEGQKSPIW